MSLFVSSRVEASQPSGSAVTNTVQAIARPSGASTIACHSRGVLERRLLEALSTSVVRLGYGACRRYFRSTDPSSPAIRKCTRNPSGSSAAV